MRAVILAAGKGTRLLPLTQNLPKPLVLLDHDPLIVHVLRSIPLEIREVVIVVGYLGDQIRTALGDRFGSCSLVYVEQSELTGTGGALACVQRLSGERLLVVNGDDLYAQEDLQRMLSYEHAVLARRTKESVANPFLVDESSLLLRGFLPGPQSDAWQNCGAYVLGDAYFSEPLEIISVRGSSEASIPHTLARIAKRCDVHIEEATMWQPVGTHDELHRARKNLMQA